MSPKPSHQNRGSRGTRGPRGPREWAEITQEEFRAEAGSDAETIEEALRELKAKGVLAAKRTRRGIAYKVNLQSFGMPAEFDGLLLAMRWNLYGAHSAILWHIVLATAEHEWARFSTAQLSQISEHSLEVTAAALAELLRRRFIESKADPSLMLSRDGGASLAIEDRPELYKVLPANWPAKPKGGR